MTDIWEKYLNWQKEIKTSNHKSRLWENRGIDIIKTRSKFRQEEFIIFRGMRDDIAFTKWEQAIKHMVIKQKSLGNLKKNGASGIYSKK